MMDELWADEEEDEYKDAEEGADGAEKRDPPPTSVKQEPLSCL
ncbi:hypothetical protein PR003_g6042 [Phytophthora rubi]|uniref:Uncharacterized protein n=1 Tax=Phytophthora rubi TaxID=129364 RepID=A0A6A3NB72_9STRA|nr:hypothetical protein PR002_g5818 [Phytophthora rubi]KAE9349163.1 hypothetical protein PR003_g6042 [Phytophthora rubi]